MPASPSFVRSAAQAAGIKRLNYLCRHAPGAGLSATSAIKPIINTPAQQLRNNSYPMQWTDEAIRNKITRAAAARSNGSGWHMSRV